MARPILSPPDLQFSCTSVSRSALSACINDNFDELFAMIDSGRILCTESITESGDQPLHLAAARGNLEAVSTLVERYKCDPYGSKKVTPLHYAALNGHLEVVKYLFSVGCRSKKSGGSALHFACYPCSRGLFHKCDVPSQNVEVIKFLIGHGWDLHQKNASGNEPLIINRILTDGSLEDLRFLVNQGFLTKASLRGLMRKLMGARNFLSQVPLYFSTVEIVEYLVSMHAIVATPDLIVSMAILNCDDAIVKCIMDCCTVPACEGSFYDVVSPIRGSKVLLDYICQNDLVLVFKAIAKNNLNFQDSKGRSLVHISCKHNKHDFVSFLVDKGCDLNLNNIDQKLPLHVACEHAGIEVVKLVSCDANINKQDASGNTPLHIACMNKQVCIAKYLVTVMHCKQDILNSRGELPLHAACMYKVLEIVELVSSVDMNVQDSSGNTPLHIACMGSEVNIVCIEYIATMKLCRQDIVNDKSEIPLHIAVTSGVFNLRTIQVITKELTISTADIDDIRGNTPLHIACSATKLNPDVIEYLACELQCRLDRPNKSGDLPLNILSQQCYSVSNYTSLVIRMISAQPDFNVNIQDSFGETLLHIACSKNLILERKSDVNLVDEGGELPLHIACRHCSLEMVKLVTNGILQECLYIKNYPGQNTPLHMALGHEYRADLGIARYIVFDKGCRPKHIPNIFSDLNVEAACADKKDFDLLALLATRDNVGHGSLRTACENGNINAVKLLQSLNYIHAPDILRIACTKSLEMVELVIHDDDVNITDSEGNSPLHIACEHNQVGVVDLLVTGYYCDQLVRQCGYYGVNELPLHLACAQSLDAVKLLAVDCCYLEVVSQGLTPFHVACKHNQLDIVQYLFKKLKGEVGCLVESTKLHPLQLACEMGNVEIVKCLIENGMNSSVKSSDGNAPLHMACSSGSFEVVQYLIDSGHDNLVRNLKQELPLHVACTKSLELVEITSHKCTIQDLEAKALNGVTPLHMASACGFPEIVKYLIEIKKCSPLTVDSSGRNALAYACKFSGIQQNMCKKSTPDVVRYLVKCGCSPTEKFWSSCGHSCSPIVRSIDLANYGLFKALVAGEAHINCQDEEGDTPLMLLCYKRGSKQFVLESMRFLLSMTCNQQLRNKKGKTALHVACENSSADIITLLDPRYANCVDGDGNTVLHIACKKQFGVVLEHLLRFKGADCNIKDKQGQAPLHLTVGRHLAVLTKKLCKIKGVDSTVKDNDGSAPVHAVCDSKQSTTILRALVMHNKTNLLLQDAKGNSPLHFFCCQGSEESLNNIKLLLAHRASVEVKNIDGDTPLHIACRVGFEKAVKALICKGTQSVSLQNNNGDTPMHLACRTGSSKIVKALIQKNYISLQNNAGDTPLHIACECKNLVLVKKLCGTSLECSLAVSNLIGNTPLHVACTVGCFEIVDFLAESQEQCIKVLTKKNEDGAIPFHIALELLCQISDLKLSTGILKKRHGSISLDTALEFFGKTLPREVARLLCYFTNHCEDINIQNGKDESLLHLACKVDSHFGLGLLRFFTQYCGADLEIVDIHSQFPLHIAASRSLEIVMLCYKECIANAQDNSGNTPLHIACLNGRGDVINFLLESQKCIPNKKNGNGRLPLHCAFLNIATSKKTIELLSKHTLRLEQSLCIQDVNGDTPLHLACKSSHQEWVLTLLQYNVGNLSLQNSLGQTPLHIACINSNLEIVETLLNSNPHCQLKKECDTALHIACRNHSADNVLEREASNIPNIQGELPIHIACKDLHSDSLLIIEALSRHVASINSQTNVGDTLLHLAIRERDNKLDFDVIKFLTDLKCCISITNDDGDTPLHLACRSEFLSSQIIKVLASKDNINVQNNSRNTAVHEICKKNTISLFSNKYIPENCSDVARLGCLIELGAKLDTPNASGQYPMHLACRFKSLEVVKLLEPYGLAVKTKDGDTVLHEACRNTSYSGLEIVRYFLNYTPALDLTSVNSDGELALHIACRTPYISQDLLNSLIKGNPNINLKNWNGDTPLHELIKSKQSLDLIATLLCTEECELGIINNKKESPLYLASKNNLTTVVRILVEKYPEGIHQADEKGQTPIMVTTNAEILNLLLENGADPTPLYEMYRRYFEKYGSSNSPMKTPISVLIIGHPCAGKTTLVSSLKKEEEDIKAETFSRTAGIVPSDFNSHIYGQVIMYDFAGQPEYYASHDAVVHNIIRKSPPIVLLVVNLTLSIEETISIVSYWSDFIKNRLVSLTDKAHLYIICSHADVLEQRNVDPNLKTKSLLRAVETKLNEIKQLHFQKMITMDCTNPQSKHMNDLRMLLAESTNQLRLKGVINFQSHCLSTFLKQEFKNEIVIPLDKLAYRASIATTENIIDRGLMPSNLALLKELCRDLSDGGVIVFLEDSTVSWIVLNKVALLNDVCGKMFAPESFPAYTGQHGSNTGVLCYSKLKQIFPQYNPNMILGFLCKMEYCQEIKDEKVLKHMLNIKTVFSEYERYYFFPSFVRIERPQKEWTHLDRPGYQFGWIMECTSGHFSPSFVQILLLRILFGSTHIRHLPQAPLDIHSMSTVWKSGILWSNTKGIDTVVDVIENSKLLVLIHCNLKDMVHCLHHRSTLLQAIRCIKEEICSAVVTGEFFITPKYIHHPLKLDNANHILISLDDIITSVSEGHDYVYSASNDKVSLGDLLLFDPYIHLCESLSATIYSQANSDEEPSDNFLMALSCHLCEHFDLFLRIIRPAPVALEEIDQLPLTEKFRRLFKLWLRRIGRTFKSIHNEFYRITVFKTDSRPPGNSHTVLKCMDLTVSIFHRFM